MLGTTGRILARNPAIKRQLGLQKRTIVNGPPQNKLSLTYKVTYGHIMGLVVNIPHFYIMYNIDYWYNETRRLAEEAS